VGTHQQDHHRVGSPGVQADRRYPRRAIKAEGSGKKLGHLTDAQAAIWRMISDDPGLGQSTPSQPGNTSPSSATGNQKSRSVAHLKREFSEAKWTEDQGTADQNQEQQVPAQQQTEIGSNCGSGQQETRLEVRIEFAHSSPSIPLDRCPPQSHSPPFSSSASSPVSPLEPSSTLFIYLLFIQLGARRLWPV